MTRRALDLADLDAVVAEAERLNELGYEKAGEWDLGQACRHSAVAIRETVDGFSFNPPGIMRLMVRLMGMKKELFATRAIKAGIKAPASMVPSPGLDEPKEIENLRLLISRLTRRISTGYCVAAPSSVATAVATAPPSLRRCSLHAPVFMR